MLLPEPDGPTMNWQVPRTTSRETPHRASTCSGPLRYVLQRSRTRMIDSPLSTLTARELDVLAEMATGATNTAIADALRVSAHSVEKHSTSIFNKLGLAEDNDVNRRVKAVLMFLAGRESPGAGAA